MHDCRDTKCGSAPQSRTGINDGACMMGTDDVGLPSNQTYTYYCDPSAPTSVSVDMRDGTSCDEAVAMTIIVPIITDCAPTDSDDDSCQNMVQSCVPK